MSDQQHMTRFKLKLLNWSKTQLIRRTLSVTASAKRWHFNCTLYSIKLLLLLFIIILIIIKI